jgi:ribonuclease HI
VLISKLPKEEAAKAHNQQIEDLLLTDSTTIYTDASSTESGKGIRVGVVIYDFSDWDKTKVHQESFNIGTSQLVYNGELEGVTRAIEYASKTAKPNESIRIFSDNQAGLWKIRTPSDNPGQDYQIRAIRAAQQIVEKGATVTLEWVPGHTDIQVNKEADKLAKAGTKEPSSSPEKASFALLGLKIRQIGTTE